MKVVGHKHVNLTAHPHHRRCGVRFETDKGKSTMLYVGANEAFQYVEGCE